jgi:hypothetical protein
MSFVSSSTGGAPDPTPESNINTAAEPSVETPAPIDEATVTQPASDSDFALFAGANAQAFAPVRGIRRWSNVCWPGFLLPAAWFLYRKMYGYAALAVLTPVIANVVHLPGNFARWSNIAFSLLGAFGKPLYRNKARRMIAEIRALSPDAASARETIAEAGGTSRAGAIFGAFLIAIFVTFAFLKP